MVCKLKVFTWLTALHVGSLPGRASQKKGMEEESCASDGTGSKEELTERGGAKNRPFKDTPRSPPPPARSHLL